MSRIYFLHIANSARTIAPCCTNPFHSEVEHSTVNSIAPRTSYKAGSGDQRQDSISNGTKWRPVSHCGRISDRVETFKQWQDTQALFEH